MKKNVFSFALVVLCGFFTFASSGNANSEAANSSSVLVKKQKFDREGIELYSTNYEMRSYKKIGLGAMLGSSTGLLSLEANINLDASEAAIIGLGTGPSYGTFSLGWKHSFEAMYLSPYTKITYSKWFNTSGEKATDSDVLKRVFSDQDLKSGRFNADFANAGFGIEYNQLEGELSGLNLFGEIALMAEVSKSVIIPTGGVGIIYYY